MFLKRKNIFTVFANRRTFLILCQRLSIFATNQFFGLNKLFKSGEHNNICNEIDNNGLLSNKPNPTNFANVFEIVIKKKENK